MQTEIKISCKDQELYFKSSPIIASGGINEDMVSFSFCPKWDGFIKTAIFYNDENLVYHQLLENDCCVIPQEVLKNSGLLYMGVFGTNGMITRTSKIVEYNIQKGAITNDTVIPDPTPDIYSQLVDMTKEAVEIAQSVRDDADAGKFNGEDGPPGKPGANILTREIVVDTPVFENPVSIVGGGALDTAFVDWTENFYFVTLKDAAGNALPSNQFRLTLTSVNRVPDYANAIDQTFELNGLDTGNSGMLKENAYVDFKTIGEDFQMRLAGVAGIDLALSGKRQTVIQVVGHILPLHSSNQMVTNGRMTEWNHTSLGADGRIVDRTDSGYCRSITFADSGGYGGKYCYTASEHKLSVIGENKLIATTSTTIGHKGQRIGICPTNKRYEGFTSAEFKNRTSIDFLTDYFYLGMTPNSGALNFISNGTSIIIREVD